MSSKSGNFAARMFRIKKLDIFMARQFALLFVATFFICQFVLMMQFLWRYVDELIGKGLSLDIMAQFFWYMALMLVPQAFPLAILLSSLITFGNLGESSELTAIKAAGISLMQSMRSLIVIVILISGLSLYFQDVVGPSANKSFYQLLISMKQTSPELEIPEGIFYDGLPGTNLYVEKKDLETGHLYGIMIYRQTNSYDDQAIILADSGMLQSTAEKKHLLLTLWSGEWFENMRSQDIAGSASVPYRRETFVKKTILLDFDGGFNLADADFISSNAKAKSTRQIIHDIDSIRLDIDSMGRAYLSEARYYALHIPTLSSEDSVKALALADSVVYDSLLARLSPQQRLQAMKNATQQAKSAANDVEAKYDMARYVNRQMRLHQIEAIGKFTLALSCIIFFFIGAPLGAIIRKGGLGIPVIISVIVFIVYYIFENSGMRMAREDEWTVWFGKSISTLVLAPLAIFFTYKANQDSTVFNIDAYKTAFRRLLGLRIKRSVMRKEVIINDPDYAADKERLQQIIVDIERYQHAHHLLRWPNPIRVFFRAGDDHEIARISEEMESVIEDLSNTRDNVVLDHLNHLPVVSATAHTRPFRRRWLNIVTGLLVPVAIVIYIRMIRYRLRLYGDLRNIVKYSNLIIDRI